MTSGAVPTHPSIGGPAANAVSGRASTGHVSSCRHHCNQNPRRWQGAIRAGKADKRPEHGGDFGLRRRLAPAWTNRARRTFGTGHVRQHVVWAAKDDRSMAPGMRTRSKAAGAPKRRIPKVFFRAILPTTRNESCVRQGRFGDLRRRRAPGARAGCPAVRAGPGKPQRLNKPIGVLHWVKRASQRGCLQGTMAAASRATAVPARASIVRGKHCRPRGLAVYDGGRGRNG